MTTPTHTPASDGSTAATPLTHLVNIADRVVALVTARAANADEPMEANVRVTRTQHGLTRFANSFIHQHVGEDTVTVSLTLAVGGRTTTATSTRVAEDELETLVDDTIAAARLQPVDPHWPGATPASEPTFTGNVDASTVTARPEDRAALVKAFVDEGTGLRAAGYVDTEVDHVAFASTAGQRVAGATSRATVDGIHQTGTSAGSGHQTSVALRDLDATAVGARAADRAHRSAAYTDLEPGTYPVVLCPEAVATLLTFLAFYGFNGKAHLEGGSFVQLGEQQLDPSISIWQDPTDPRAIALPFDAEGTPRTRYALVDRGVSNALAHDRRTAARAGTTSTGDAIPGGESFGAVPTTIVLPAGDTPVAELTAGIDRGLLITEFNYVRVLDPKTVVATGLTRNGTFLVEDGEVAGAVSNLRFTQSFVQALAEGNVRAIGDDARYANGEFAAGMILCPSITLEAWRFTGGASG